MYGKLTHVTMHYFPVRGGQEVYIEELNSIIKDLFNSIEVIQPSKPGIGKVPENVHLTKRLPFFSRIIPEIDWLWYNLMLKLFKRELNSSDCLITHYPIHFEATKKIKNNIVVSHGVDWILPPKSFIDKLRDKRSKKILGKCTIVANDTSFLREIGMNIEPAKNEFTEVEENVWYIPNCVDPSYYSPVAREKEDIILIPRNIRRARGIHYAIEIFSYLRKNLPTFKLYIVGGPLEGEYYEECCELVEKYSLGEEVVFVGSKSREELLELYRVSKCSLIPTISQEGTSLSALESMACATLTVSSEVGGLLDLPTEKIPLENAAKAANIIEDCLKKHSEIGTLQREEVVKTFNYENWSTTWKNAIIKTTSKN